MTEKERMLSQKLYIASDAELTKDFARSKELTHRFNETRYGENEKRYEILKDLFKKIGEKCYIEPPFRCDYGCNITVGNNFYANYDCIILDVCDVEIGENVFFAPKVCIFTAAHPIDAEVRNTQLEYGKRVKIGSNVWIGGNTVVNPGVTIGDNSVIGSGSVVTKDIPSGVIAAGNPCKVIREITESDKKYWNMLKDEYYSDKIKA